MAQETSAVGTNKYGIPQNVYEEILEAGRQLGLNQAEAAVSALHNPQPGERKSQIGTPIEELQLDTGTYHKLKQYKFHTIGDLMASSASQLRDMSGLGDTRIDRIRGKLAGAGYVLPEHPHS